MRFHIGLSMNAHDFAVLLLICVLVVAVGVLALRARVGSGL